MLLLPTFDRSPLGTALRCPEWHVQYLSSALRDMINHDEMIKMMMMDDDFFFVSIIVVINKVARR